MRASGARRGGPAAVELAQAADAAGFDSIWTVEHVVVPHGYQSRYPYSETGRMGSGLEDLLFNRSRTPGADSQRRSSLRPGSTVAEESLDVLRLRPLPVLLSPPGVRDVPAPVGWRGWL
jgi:hypothetical protein